MNLLCQKCGHSLEVDQRIKYITCGTCNSTLEVKSIGATFFTEVVKSSFTQRSQDKEIPRQPASSKKSTKDVKYYERQLKILDSDWKIREDDFTVEGKYGRRSIAKPSNAIGGVIASMFGVFWTVMAFNIAGGDSFFPYFGILFIILGIVMAINHYDKGTRYIQAKKEYLKERERIKQKLKSVE